MAPSRNLTVQIVGDTRGFDRAMVRASASSGKFAASLKAASLGAAGLAGAGVKLAVDFDKSMRNVNSIAQLPQKRFAALEKQVLKLAGKTAQAPKTLADGLYDLVSSGFNAHQSMVILAKSAKAATAGLTDTATSTAAVAAVLNAYHEKAKDAGKVSDTLFQTVNRGVITFEELAQNIGDVLPFASSLGVNLQQLGASISTMTKEGISAPETMTRIKNVMVTLLKPGDALKKAFKALGVESGEALIKQKGFQGALEAIIGTTDGSKKAVAQLFPNIRALGGALALTGKNAKSANTDVKAFGKVAGATNKALSQQAKSVSYQWQRLKAQTEALAISVGSKVLPQISQLIKLIGSPKLTNDEKFQRIAKILETDMSNAFNAVAKGAEKVGPKVASAFVKAFVDAPVWAKILGGAFLLKKVGVIGGGNPLTGGGRGGLLSKAAPIPVFVVNMGGKGLGGGIAGGLGKDVGAAGAGAGALARIKPFAKAGGKLAGKFAALDYAINLVDQKGNPIAAGVNTAHDLTFGVVPKVQVHDSIKANIGGFQKQLQDLSAAGNVAGLQKIERELGKFSHYSPGNGIKETLSEIRGLISAARTSGPDAMRKFSRSIDQTDPGLEKYGARLSAARDKLATLRKGSNAYTQAAGDMRAAQKGVNDRLVDMLPVSSQVRSAVKKLGVNFANLGGDVAGAASYIAAATNQVLSGLGAKTIKFSLKESQRLRNHAPQEGAANIPGRQRGGAILDGKPSGDSVPALLERGEYVLNRNAVAKVGRDRLDALNFRHASRFQQGGQVGGLKPGIAAALRATLAANPGGTITSGLRTSMPLGHPDLHNLGEAVDIAGSPGWMLKTAAWIKQHLGRSLAEGIHNPNLSIKNGQQVSPSFWGASTWSAHANHIHMAVIGALRALGFTGDIPKIGVAGPGGPMKQILTGAIRKMRAAAQSKVNAANMAGPGVEAGSGLTSAGGEFNKGALKRLWVQAGGPKNIANLMAAIALAESGGDPTAHNPSGASGLWQILGVPFPGNVYDPLTNARMAVAKYMSQGLTAWTTYSDGSYRKYLQRGGMVGFKNGGGVGLASPFGATGPAGIAGGLGGTLDVVRNAKNVHLRRRAVSTLVKKLDRLGVLPKGLSKSLAKFASNDTIYGDRADRAGQLADAGLPAVVNGKTQAQWLTAELENLLKWRNAMIRAVETINRRRVQVAKFTERAKKRLAAIRKQLDRASLARQIKQAEQNLKRLQRHPKGKGKQITAASRLLHVLSQRNKGNRAPLLREENALTGRILPALSKQAGNLNDARGTLLSTLTDVQGPGSSMKILRALPTVGTLGGSIFNTQMQLRQLAQPATATDSTASTGTSDNTSARADLLQTLLQQANLRTAVSEAQFKALSTLPPYGGSFDTGGVVPGPAGAARTAVVHGGEGVFTPDQMAAMGGGQPTQIVVVVKDGAVDPRYIEIIADGVAQKVVKQQSRRGGRNLPGRAGALH